MRSTPRDPENTLSGVTGTNPSHGQHDPYSQQGPQNGWYTQPTPPPAPKKSMSTGMILAIVFASIAALCVLGGIGAALAPKDDKPAGQTTQTTGTAAPAQPAEAAPATSTAAPPTTAPATPAPPAGPKTSFADGTWEVGAGAGQVAPGKYKTTVPDDSWGCYWERLRGTGGSFDEIITNGNAEKNTPVVVTIAAGDKAFKSERCGTWTKA